jgi:hypothetical protein
MKARPFTLLNTLEQETPAVLPVLDPGLLAEEEAHAANSDRWGHVCSAKPDRLCCGECERKHRDHTKARPNEQT